MLAVKEALNNIAKHSGATEVWLRVAWAFPQLELTIRDNGRGLPPANGHANGDGDGLANMRQRLQVNGGDISIETPATGGTLVRMILPIGSRSPQPGERPVP